MTYIKAFYLAVLQGITEFLPVSSSGHLVILQNILGVKDVPVMFDLVLHLGTTVAVIIFYRRDIYYIIRDLYLYFVNINNKEIKIDILKRGNIRLFLYITVATMVTGMLGYLLADKITSFFYRPKLVSVFLIVTSVILISTKLVKRNGIKIIYKNYSAPIIIGLAQSLAMLPGISRSGSTISFALYIGVEREDAGRFSFLIAIPSILGAALFEYIKRTASTLNISQGIYIFSFLISFIFGLLALQLLVFLLKKGKLHFFGIYCFVVGILSLIFI